MFSQFLALNTILLSVGVGCNNLTAPIERNIHDILQRNAERKTRFDKKAKQDKLERVSFYHLDMLQQ